MRFKTKLNNESKNIVNVNQKEQFWKKYHEENDKPYMFSTTIKKAVKDLNISSVLEVGCGFGNNLKSFDNVEATGVDISDYAIKIAKQRFPNFRFLIGNALKIPLQESFDLVLTSAVLEHIKPDLVKSAMEELFRLSKKYILNIEAYDNTEHEINWHRGKGTFWTLHMAKRWQNFPVTVLSDYDVDDEYRLTLVVKRDSV